MQTALFSPQYAALGDVESHAKQAGYSTIIGVDEAGRGPLAGPVFAAAVCLDVDHLDDDWIGLLDDSKKLNTKRRQAAFEAIQQHARAYYIAHEERETIDTINILQATRLAMRKAVEEVHRILGLRPDLVYIDGNTQIDTQLRQETVVRGDGLSLHIAAASILAKVARDQLMVEHSTRWPNYGFEQNKGYGTKAHRDAIARYGPCPIHRRCFAGVKEHCQGPV
jgi:ribonuclease HII